MKRNINNDELLILDSILSSKLTKGDEIIFFVDAPSVTGKMCLYICLIHLQANEIKV